MGITKWIVALIVLAAPALPADLKFTGHVRDGDGKPVVGARVTFAPKDSPAAGAMAIAGDQGYFDSGTLAPGTYTIAVDNPADKATNVVGDRTLRDAASDLELTICDDACKKTDGRWPWAVGLLVFYLAFIEWVRINKIAIPTRQLLLSRLRDVDARAQLAGFDEARRQRLTGVITRLEKLDWIDVIIWSRGTENAAYQTIHFYELELVQYLPDETVVAQLSTARDRLAGQEAALGKSLAARIDAALKCNPVSVPKLKALLVEAQYYLYGAGDAEFSEYTGWLNKAVWLSACGLVLALVLGVTVGKYILFVAGAAGGFLSRLSRQLRRANVPSDYGASWSLLFLSPVVGALSGWFGILLIHLGTRQTVPLLGSAFYVVQWAAACRPETLAAAFPMGFSEQLFDNVFKKLEDSIVKTQQDADKPTAPPAPSPDIPRGTIDPPQAAPGDEVTVTLENLVASKVDEVRLSTGATSLSIKPVAPADKTLKFTIPPGTAAGTYSVQLAAAGASVRIAQTLTVV